MANLSLSDPQRADTEHVVLKALRQAAEPLTSSRLRESLTGPYRLPTEVLTTLLETMVEEGKVFRYSPYRSRQPRYGHHPPEQHACQVMRLLLAERPHTLTELQRRIASRLADCPAARRKQLLEQMVQQGDVLRLPCLPGSKTNRYGAHPPDPRDYLESLVKKFVSNVQRQSGNLAGVGVSVRQTLDAARQLLADRFGEMLADEVLADEVLADEEPPGGPATADTETAAPEPIRSLSQPPESPAPFEPSASSESSASPDSPASPASKDAELVLEQLAEIASSADGGPLVPVRQLRQALEFRLPDKDRFDALLLELARRGRLALYQHDYPASLTESERHAFVRDADGNYYNGVSRKRPVMGELERDEVRGG